MFGKVTKYFHDRGYGYHNSKKFQKFVRDFMREQKKNKEREYNAEY